MITLAFISLTTPLMLWGLGLLTLPLLAHLLNRQARKRIIFPSIKLLRDSAANQSRLFKLRRLILLALRCLVVAMIAWAFAMPVWLNARTPELQQGQGAAVVVIVDASASTAQQENGVALINSIRVAAQRTLDSLQLCDDLADVVYATARPEAVFGQLSHNLGALREQLEQLQPTYERADLAGSFALAGKLLNQSGEQRRLVIVSDMQESNWVDVVSGGATGFGALLPRGTRITFVDIKAKELANIALSQPRSSPMQPIAGQPMQFVVTMTNHGDQESRVHLTLTVDRQINDAQDVVLAPWEKREIAFDSMLEKVGEHQIEFTIGADSLLSDNRACAVVNVVRHVPVVLVSDDDPNEQGTSGYFITRALAPHGDESDHFEVRRVGSAELTSEIVNGAAALFIGDIGALDSAPALAIIDYLKAGGGVIFFCGDGPVQNNLILLDSLAGDAGLMPWTPGAVRDLNSIGGALRINSGAWQSRLLRAFDERSQVALSQIAFGRVIAALDIKPDARILLTFSDGTPALASRSFGMSQMLVANFSPSLLASDLGRYGAFVALMQSLVQELQPQTTTRLAPVVGQAFQFPSLESKGANQSVEVVGPDGQLIESAESSGDGKKLIVSLPRPSKPGFYQVKQDGDLIATAAINLDPRESDLRRIDQQLLLQQLQARGSELQFADLDQSGPIMQLRGRPLWSWFIVAAMILMACEMGFLLLWRRA